MVDISFMDSVKTMPVLFIRRDSPAWGMARRLAREKLEPGRAFAVSEEELQSLKDDVVALAVPPEEKGE